MAGSGDKEIQRRGKRGKGGTKMRVDRVVVRGSREESREGGKENAE